MQQALGGWSSNFYLDFQGRREGKEKAGAGGLIRKGREREKKILVEFKGRDPTGGKEEMREIREFLNGKEQS